MFLFSRNTSFVLENGEKITDPVKKWMHILERDRDKVFAPFPGPQNTVLLKNRKMEAAEQYKIHVSQDRIQVMAGDDLGMIYALIFISRSFLGILPFWFFMDQEILPRNLVEIGEGICCSEPFAVRFRGWFLNDEVLMMQWKFNENGVDGWEMALEALVRCGGNMVIPGTDRMSRRNRKLAADMGLWITHHHAEPLGAEMFARVYPDLKPDFLEQKNLFIRLWEEAVIEQKDYKVVWNLCFRGQGDMPFWANDCTGRFDSPVERGKIIGEVIRLQYQLVKKHVRNPVFCTNLYGEIMELYEQGYLELMPDIIKVRADNGYGKMVTRRQNNHNPRISSMPDASDKSPQGIYYHVSFYDLQAANHITMHPNSVDFVDRELTAVLGNGGKDFWIINGSNIRPHVYYLDAVRKKWCGQTVGDESHSYEFAEEYFKGNQDVATCYRQYPKVMIPYGEQEDEHMGEQYYAENLRVLVNHFFVDRERCAESLQWMTGKESFSRQVEMICLPCGKGLPDLKALLQRCQDVSDALTGEERRLFDATIRLQVKIHALCAEGTDLFGKGYKAYLEKDYMAAFMCFGDSAQCFAMADQEMTLVEYGVWEDFYKNDCLADIRYTGYMVQKMMGFMRELGDSTYHEKWQHQYVSNLEDRGICLLMFTERHKTDWEIFLAMKEKIVM